MKYKRIIGVLFITLVSTISLLGCEANEESNLTVNESSDLNIGLTQEIVPESAEAVSDSRYSVGETVTFITESGGMLNVTLTDWGSVKDGWGETVLYVDYEIENIGKKKVFVGSGLFDVYADNYSVEAAYVRDDNTHSVNLSSGRKTEGTFYAKTQPDNVSVIEVECGDSVFVLKDLNAPNMRAGSSMRRVQSGAVQMDIPEEFIEIQDGEYVAEDGSSIIIAVTNTTGVIPSEEDILEEFVSTLGEYASIDVEDYLTYKIGNYEAIRYIVHSQMDIIESESIQTYCMIFTDTEVELIAFTQQKGAGWDNVFEACIESITIE